MNKLGGIGDRSNIQTCNINYLTLEHIQYVPSSLDQASLPNWVCQTTQFLTPQKKFILRLLATVQLDGYKRYGMHLEIYYETHKYDDSFSWEYQKHLYNASRKNGVIDQGKYVKLASKQKWTEMEYHVKEDDDVTHKGVKMFYNTTDFTSLPCFDIHKKPHGLWDLRKNNHMWLDPKLGHVTCAILQIPCACYAFKYMLDKP